MAHGNRALRRLPRNATTVFPKVAKARKPKRSKVTLLRETWVTVHFPSAELMEAFRKGLSQARCAFETDRERRIIRYPKHSEGTVRELVKSLRNDYQIRFEDKVKL